MAVDARPERVIAAARMRRPQKRDRRGRRQTGREEMEALGSWGERPKALSLTESNEQDRRFKHALHGQTYPTAGTHCFFPTARVLPPNPVAGAPVGRCDNRG